MYNVTAFAFPLSPTTPQASVASIITPSQPALGRLPTQVVAGATSYAEIRNEAKNNPPFAQDAESAATLPAAGNDAFSIISAKLTNTRISSFPSLFFAQLLSQGMDEQTQSLVVSYETMLEYGSAKYKPSNATQPQAANPMLDFLKTLTEESAAPANQNPPTPPAANSNATRPAPPAVADIPAAINASAGMKKPGQAPAPAPAAKSTYSSFLRAYGSQAYSNAALRMEPPVQQKSLELVTDEL